MHTESGLRRATVLLMVPLLVLSAQGCQRSPGPSQPRNLTLLGSAESFAVLGSQAVTNTGPTTVVGDLGLSPGTAVTGFPPGQVAGTIHAADGVALQARTDANAAYIDAAGRPCNVDLSGQDLGGQTLVPGVYCFTTSAQLTGALVLDTQGDPAAAFIFQIGSTLTTASDASVLVLGGAGCSNVTWQVGSSATFGTRTVLVGDVLALTSITLTTGANVAGRVLALNGAVTLDTNHVGPGVCASDGGVAGTGGAGAGGDSVDASGSGGQTATGGISGSGGVTGVGGGSGGQTGAGGNTGSGGERGAGGSSGGGGKAGASGSGGYGGKIGMGGNHGYGGKTAVGGSSGYAGKTGAGGSSGYAGNTGAGGSSGYAGNTGAGGNSGYAGNTGAGGKTGRVCNACQICGDTYVDIHTDNDNCGACGKTCPWDSQCVAGSCTCMATTCGSICVKLDENPENCGACGHACDATQWCNHGTCAAVCAGTLCDGWCTDLLRNDYACGACGHECGAAESCVDGVCACNGTMCGAACVDVSSSATDCGTCGHTCADGQCCTDGQCIDLQSHP
jgi:hypothetical protein